MSLCRICLCSKPGKYINQLYCKNGSTQSFKDVISFCFAIQIPQDSIVNTKLCVSCYRKIIDFYEFKTLAIKNDIYWQSLDSSELKNVVYLNEIHIKKEETEDSHNENNEALFFDDFEVKQDDYTLKELSVQLKEEIQSDDELLSVIKKVKTNSAEETKENAPIKKKKGRPKLLNIHKTTSESKICEECGKAVKNLKAHLLKHIPLELRKKIKCELCDKIFASNTLKQKHIKRKHLCLKKQCHLCNKSVSNLRLHIQLIHNPESLRFKCVSCDRRFATQGRLDSHVSVHTKDRPFECDICGNKFRIKLSLDMHKRQVHDKERTHLCQFCSKRFFKKHHLNVHLRSHTQEKPYPCPECGKHFQSSTTLKNHLLIHGKEKKYNCSMCDMSFATGNYLRSHLVSHTKEKRYPCQYCDVRFHRSDHRKRHEFTAHLRHTTATTSPATAT